VNPFDFLDLIILSLILLVISLYLGLTNIYIYLYSANPFK